MSFKARSFVQRPALYLHNFVDALDTERVSFVADSSLAVSPIPECGRPPRVTEFRQKLLTEINAGNSVCETIVLYLEKDPHGIYVVCNQLGHSHVREKIASTYISIARKKFFCNRRER